MTITNSKPAIRFATLIRVSTEKQEKQGESLRTQKTHLDQAVKQLNGVIAARYGGQEHATLGWEHTELNRLLADAGKKNKPFNAVIIADATRWSRDNVVSETGLAHLQNNKIRFFVLTTEYNLFDTEARLFLGLTSTIGAYQARTQKQKSLLNRIHRAKRGIPTCGNLPFGRTIDKTTGKWGVDPKKLAMIEDVARRYLDGERLTDLAKEYGVNHSNLHKILTKRSGKKWVQVFDCKDLNIHEEVTTSVPSLLPNATIKAILDKMAANKTYQHGRPKHPYLFSGMVFCSHCGYAMLGQTNPNGQQYYRHASVQRENKCPIHPKPWVRCDELENAVMSYLFETFGNPEATKRAIEKAMPNLDKIKELQKRRERIKKSLATTEAARERILRLVSKETLTEDQAEKELERLKKEEATQQEALKQLDYRLQDTPTPEEVKEISKEHTDIFKKYPAHIRAVAKCASSNYEKMTWKDKRALAASVFRGHTPEGRPNGIYIESINGQTNHRHKVWSFTLHGKLINLINKEKYGKVKLTTNFTLSHPCDEDQIDVQSPWHSPSKALRECNFSQRRPQRGR